MGVSDQRHAQDALPSGYDFRRHGGPQDQSGRMRKILPSTGIRSADRPDRIKSYRLGYPIAYINFSSVSLIFVLFYFTFLSNLL